MSNKGIVAASVGAVGGLLFLITFVAWLYGHPDPQNGIALLFSPFYAIWIGGSVYLIAFGCLLVAERRLSQSVIWLILGIIGAGSFALFLGGEVYQATHPTR